MATSPTFRLRVCVLLTGLAFAALAPAQPYGTSGGRDQEDAARANLAYAQANVETLKQRAMRSLARDRQWVAAKDAVAKAQKERQAIRDAVARQVAETAEYKSLQQNADASSSEVQKAELRASMAMLVWNAQSDSAECQDADARLKEAQAALDERWKDYEAQVLANDRDWTNALAAREAARAQVAAAVQSRQAARSTSSGAGRSSGRSSSGSRGTRNRSY